MSKLRFSFQVKASQDGKSNYIAITSINTEDNKTFLIPEEYQESSYHKEICATNHFNMIRNTLKRRRQSRNIWVALTEEIKKTYFDEDGNMIFMDMYLDEAEQGNSCSSNATQMMDANNQSLVEILEKLVGNKEKQQEKNARKAAERFVLEKYDGRTANADQWLEIFEKECDRFGINNDQEKIEIFRLFLEKSCVDWYNSMMTKYSFEHEWTVWRRNFCQTYANKGWSTSRYAIAFKYQTGSLLEYAVKKEKLLLEVRKTIDQGTLIDLIAAGLPDFVVDRMNREQLFETQDLFNEIGRLEHLVKRKTSKPKFDAKPIQEKKQKCTICEKLKKGERFHSESSCWFNEKNKRRNNDKGQIKIINNSELECELQDGNSKN